MSGTLWNGSLLYVKVLGYNSFASNIAEGMEYAYLEGARIMNMSMSGTYASGESEKIWYPIRDFMLETPDVLYVVSSGNAGIDLDNTSGPGMDWYPAEFDVAHMIVVGASDGQDARAAFSNYGATSVDVFAPGVDIVGITVGENVVTDNGTSFAAPIVSAIAALKWQQVPGLLAKQVKEAIMLNGDVTPSLSGKCVGLGGGACVRINPVRTLGGTCP